MKHKTHLLASILLAAVLACTCGIAVGCDPQDSPDVTSVALNKAQLPATIEKGESFPYDEVKLTVSYDDDTEKTLSLGDEGVTSNKDSLNLGTVGQKTLTVSYGGKSDSHTFSVVEPAKPTVTSIAIKTEGLPTSIEKGGTFPFDQVKITATYSDKSVTELSLSDEGVTSNKDSLDLDTVGRKTLTVTYEQRSALYSFVVTEPGSGEPETPIVTSIAIKNVADLPTKIKKGGTFPYDSIQLTVSWSNGTTTTVAFGDDGVTSNKDSLDLDVSGAKTLTIAYNGATTEFAFTVLAPTVDSIAIKEPENLPKILAEKAEFPYEDITLLVSWSDETKTEVPLLTDGAPTQGVEYDPIDMSKAGEKTLTITYGDAQTTYTFQVAPTSALILSFSLPDSYTDYQNKSTSDEFKIHNNPYLVGTDNDFVFLPKATTAGEGNLDYIFTKTSVFSKDDAAGEYAAVADLDGFVEIDNATNTYRFGQKAVGKYVKLEITVDKSIHTATVEDAKLTPEFKVVEGYNVYDMEGLSVFDNLNVTEWATLKDKQLPTDDKKLSEYTDVKRVILHNDIVIDPDKLPESYFWKTTDEGYPTAYALAAKSSNPNFADKLEGSLNDGTGNGQWVKPAWQNINMQKGLFNTDQTSLSGNYKTISVGTASQDGSKRVLKTIIGSASKETTTDTKKIDSPVPHWSVFKVFRTADDIADNKKPVDVSFENVALIGNMQRTEENVIQNGAGMMAFGTYADKVTFDNITTNRFYTHVIADNAGAIEPILEIKNTIMTDAYSNMTYMWRSTVNVVNSSMKGSGGPVFILCDGTSDATNRTDDQGAKLTVDDVSEFESWAQGQEAWYQEFDAQPLVTQLKTVEKLLPLTFQKTLIKSDNGNDLLNIIAVIIPEPGDIINPPSDKNRLEVYGSFTRTSETPSKKFEFAMHDPIAVQVKQQNTVLFTSSYANEYGVGGMPTALHNNYAAVATQSSLMNPLAQSASISDEQWKAGWKATGDLLGVYLHAGQVGGTDVKHPYFGAIFGGFTAVSA